MKFQILFATLVLGLMFNLKSPAEELSGAPQAYEIANLGQQLPAKLDPLSEAEDQRDISAPILAQAASSNSPRVRRRLAQVLGRIKNSAGLPELYKLAQDSDEYVKAQSLFSLGQFGWQTNFANGHESEITAAIRPVLSDKHVNVRIQALNALGKTGLLQTPDLVGPSLTDSNKQIRAAALTALTTYHYAMNNRGTGSTITPLSDALMNVILNLAHDTDASVRQKVALFFSAVTDKRIQTSLLDLLAHEHDVSVRYYALKALARQKDSTGIAPTLASLAHPHYVIRTAALQTLTTLKATSQLTGNLLKKLSKDPVFHVRSALASGIVKGAPAEQLNALNEFLHDRSGTVRASALRAFATIQGDAAEPAIITGLADKNWGVRVAAVDAAQSLTTDQESILQKAYLDTQVLVRDEALGALSAIATPSAFSTIQKALSSDQLSERNSAIYALEGRAEATIPALFYSTYLASLNNTKWVGLRQEVANDLVAIPGDQTTAYLKTLATDSDYTVASTAQTELTVRKITGLPPLPVKQLSYSPYRNLTFKRDPIIVFETRKGRIEILCHASAARITTASIAGFAASGGYDGLPWHRVVSDFVIQGGDPDKTGYGDAGWTLREEINPIKFDRGAVGIARSSDFDSGVVQIFINTVPTPSLDGQYTVFAHVISGMDVVDRIEMGDLILKAYVR